jgi:CRISPR-associated endonuclease/helicase Cas3
VTPLAAADFSNFFREVQGGAEPFPWQTRLVRHVVENGQWPSVLDLPTGSGKTAAIDIAVFHLALEAARGPQRRAPVRVAFVVDRRLVVDDAFLRARRIADRFAIAASGTVTARVAENLRSLSDGGPPLIVRRLRGGIPREDDWARTPAQPTVLCSTVDQIGSRLLFRGYGVSDSMKPVHAGLIGADCLILLDEAHLAEPFRQTLRYVETYRGPRWRAADAAAPWGVSLLTATPGELGADRFALDDEDRFHPLLARRLTAAKPARLVGPAKTRGDAENGSQASEDDAEIVRIYVQIVEEVEKGLAAWPADRGPPAVGVVMNRVARARHVFERLRQIHEGRARTVLLIGPARPLDRDKLADELAEIRTGVGAERRLSAPLIVVATQCIEAGVDIDLDILVTELAPLDSLRQRFGRLNRAGRDIGCHAAIVAAKSVLSPRYDDPVHGSALKPAWDYLVGIARAIRGIPVADFGVSAFELLTGANPIPPEALARKADAPVLLPAHLDLFSQTAPIPAADPEVALYLHGPNRELDSITIVWRADIDPVRSDRGSVLLLLTLVPPRPTEAIELPLWAVRRWLADSTRILNRLADVVGTAPEDEERERAAGAARRAFRWAGDSDRSDWVAASALRPGDMIVVPASYGGLDEFGWNPTAAAAVADLGREAAVPFAARRFAVRVAPGAIGPSVGDDALAAALAGAASQRWEDLRESLRDLELPDRIRGDLERLGRGKPRRRVVPYLDLYGSDGEARPRGVVFAAPSGINIDPHAQEDEEPSTTEDDSAGSLPGYPLSLAQHSRDVEGKAEEFARAAGLPPARVADLLLAGWVHDSGKVDPRFQSWLRYDDPLGPDPSELDEVLAKSGRALPAASRTASRLPANWRHEALSVRLAPLVPRFTEAQDPELVLYLVGTHHGWGRPFFPHLDPDDAKPRESLPPVLGIPAVLPAGAGPQSPGFDWRGLDWPALFERLKARYGVWELARMEAILRLADHRASQEAAQRVAAQEDPA